ncbi:MAG: NAD(P)/FAD-dependent oxidoreductase [Chloroflexi bacterium]|nr:MAG: NAD(P)/FAD-dependent oxidoreductase [Chloroflexota bacterium]
MPGKTRTGIIGAGVAGLSAAWDLARAGHEVVIYEAQPTLGGLAAGFRDAHWDWALEKFYHHWFETDSDVLGLIEEIGQSDKVLFPRPKTSYWIDGKIYRSEISLSALLLPLSPLAKLRLALAGVYIKFTSNWQALEKHTAHDWLRRYMGEEAYRKLWAPLLIGKFGEAYQSVNMAWFWARVYKRSLRLGTYKGGFQAFLDALGAAVEQQGVAIHLNTPVEKIEQQDEHLVLSVNGRRELFDKVISTVSPHLTLRLAPQLAHTEYGQTMSELKSIGAVCVVVALKHSLLTDGTYWLNLPATSADKQQSEFPFLALVEHTNWMERSHYGDDHLIYCGDYIPADHEYFQLSEDELAERFIAQLSRFNPEFSRDWVRKYWVWRAPYAQPVPGVNHSEKILPLKTPLSGLYWASMSQVYPWDRGTNYAVEIGRRAAKLIIEDA